MGGRGALTPSRRKWAVTAGWRGIILGSVGATVPRPRCVARAGPGGSHLLPGGASAHGPQALARYALLSQTQCRRCPRKDWVTCRLPPSHRTLVLVAAPGRACGVQAGRAGSSRVCRGSARALSNPVWSGTTGELLSCDHVADMGPSPVRVTRPVTAALRGSGPAALGCRSARPGLVPCHVTVSKPDKGSIISVVSSHKLSDKTLGESR